jgi:hypothetical protein
MSERLPIGRETMYRRPVMLGDGGENRREKLREVGRRS